MKAENHQDKQIEHNPQHCDKQDVHRQHTGIPFLDFYCRTLSVVSTTLILVAEVSVEAVER